MLTTSNATGYAVLAAIFDKYGDETNDMMVEPYLNGNIIDREAGFAVTHKAKVWIEKAVFSNQRRTDGIALYLGKSFEFSMQGNGLTEEIYQNSKWFDQHQYVEAATAAWEFITKGVVAVQIGKRRN